MAVAIPGATGRCGRQVAIPARVMLEGEPGGLIAPLAVPTRLHPMVWSMVPDQTIAEDERVALAQAGAAVAGALPP